MLLKSITLCCLMLNVQTQNPFYPQQYPNPDFIYFNDNLPQTVPLPGSNRVFQNQAQKTVEIQKSVGTEFGTTVETESKGDKSNLVSRQITTPSIETMRQLAQQRQFISQGTPNRQTVPQTSQYTPEISLGRPSVAVPQNALGRPSVPQGQSNPSASSFNTQAEGFNTLLYSVTNFGVNLLKNIDAMHPGNLVISPFSITSLLALLQQGAVGDTQAQITNALQMTPETTVSAYAQVTGDVQSRNTRNVLRVANNLFISEAFVINQNFKRVAISSFNSDITPLSYTRPEQAAREINSWVASRTDNKIERLIAPDALDAATQMVLVNAIYFKGLWEVPFRVESTINREFQLTSGQTKTAQFMRTRRLFKTGVDKTTNAKIIILPFERDEYHLMVILPSQLMNIRSTLSSLTDARLVSYLSFPALDTELEMPKFTVRADTDLKVLLKNMGVTNIFGRYAELDNVGIYGAVTPMISSAVHSAVLSIDEKGGSAAAATAFAAVALSYDDPAVQFKVNRPFIAVLWDNTSSLPLFMAKIEDPNQ